MVGGFRNVAIDLAEQIGQEIVIGLRLYNLAVI
jgi:hypothetical protein